MSVDSPKETKRLLFQSCKDGCAATIQHLLTQHSDLRDQINSPIDDDGNTTLIVASKTRHTGIVKLLLQCGANVDHKNSSGWTALMKASENGDSKLEIIELLLKHGAQVDLQNDAGECALIVAAQNGQAKLAAKLVQEYRTSVGLNQKHSNWTALMEASESGSIDIVKLLLEHGADDLGWALVPAILNKHTDIIELLLEHGAQVDDKNWSLFLDQPPLVAAVETGDADIVKLLLEHGTKQRKGRAITNAIFSKNTEIICILSERGAQVDEDRLYPLLVEAFKNGNADVVKLLLEHGAKQGIDRAMKEAICNKNAEIIKILSEYGTHTDNKYQSDEPPLVVAVEKGDADVVKLLLKYTANVDHKNSNGWTALMKASKKGDSKLEIIELLLKHGAQVDLQNDAGESALIVAAQNGQAKLATKLVQEYGASVGLKNKHSSWTALMEASESGSIDIVKLLLEHGADDLGWALVLAILNKHNDIIELLLEHGVQVDDKNWSLFLTQPPLVAAVETGDADIVKQLLKHGAKQGIEVIHILSGHGAQVDEIDLPDQLPLVEAVEKGDANLVKLLLEHGTKQGIYRAIAHAIFSKNADIVQMLSKYGAQNWFDEPPLLEAVEKGDADVVKLLLKHGANVDEKNLDGWTALMKASKKGDSKLEIIEVLLKYGAKVDLQNDAGESALMVAAQNSQAKVATKLVHDCGASVDLKNKHSNWTALMEASESGSVDIVKLLLDHGADDLGWALVLAILNKHNDIIELLLECGAQVDDTNWSRFLSQSPLIAAIEIGDAGIVKLLLKHGAKQGIEVIRMLSGHGTQVDEIDLPDSPLLLEAVETGDADVVKLLLEHGAKEGMDWAMTNAIFDKNAEIVEMLSEHGAQVEEDWLNDDPDPLVEAIEEGDADIIKLLLAHGAELEWFMSVAIINDQIEIIQMLLEHGAQVNDFYKEEIESDDEPDLVTACTIGNPNIVKLLLEHGAKECQYRGWALTEAILHKHTEVVDLLLEHGVCVADDGDRTKLDRPPAIVEASKNSDIDSLKLLLKYGEKEQYQDILGWALSEATTPEIFRLLLDNGAGVDEMVYDDAVPLVSASRCGNTDGVKLMLSHGAKKYLPEALIEANKNKHTDIIEQLMSHGAHVDDESWFDFENTPALVKASMWGNIETVKLLSKHGAEKNLDWALEAASEGGHTEIVNFLFDYGIEVDDCDMFDTAALVEASRNGKTDTVRFLFGKLGIMNRLGLALRAASGEGHVDIVRLLSEYGNADDLGYALIEASRSGHTEAIKFLIKCDVFVDFQDEEQNTALIIAGRNGHTDSTELLIECGAEVNLQNSHGISALMAASQANHTDVVKMLLKYGANVNLEDNNGQTAAKVTNDNVLALFAAISDDGFDTIESEVDLHEEVQLTQEEEAHLLAIENAITETGMLDHTLVHGVFVGPPRSGKDSIMKRLLGQAASKISPSTGAVETAIHVKVEESCTYAATIGQSTWTRLEYDEEALHLMKTTSNNSSSATYPVEGEESTDTQIADPPLAVKNTTPDNFDNPQKKNPHMQTESTSEIQPEIDPQPVDFQDETSVQINIIEQMHQKTKHI